MKAEAARWLETAEIDFRTAEIILAGGVHANAAFHLQQAAEKAFKALLAEMGEREVTHSCVGMMVVLKRLGIAFPPDMDTDLRRLDRCFIDTRYPNGVGVVPETLFNQEIVEDLMACCRRVMAFVKSNLS